MQATEADIHHLKGDEDGIHFRPSPNFKHMKKYLKSKFEEANATGGEQASAEEEEPQVNSTSVMLQPPLPPNPPPPDSPLQITLKTEVEDDEYQNSENSRNQNENEDLPQDFSMNRTQTANDKQKVMCRQFARGACTRGASCIYVHELILDQLPGIYTFCKNYQNSGCNFPRCKFVHATVFEKEYFYRTGYLPPHSLAHLKDNTVGHPPPPLPEGTQTEVPVTFPNPPPPVMLPGMSGPPPNPTGAMASGSAVVAPPDQMAMAAAAAAAASTTVSPLKRDWAQLKDFGAVAHDGEVSEPAPKQCKHCEISELRIQYNKNKLEMLKRSIQENSKKLTLSNKKKNALYSTVISLLRNTNLSKNTASSGHISSQTSRNEKDKVILENLKTLFSGNRGLLNSEDNATNMSTVLVRLLLSTGEQLSEETS